MERELFVKKDEIKDEISNYVKDADFERAFTKLGDLFQEVCGELYVKFSYGKDRLIGFSLTNGGYYCLYVTLKGKEMQVKVKWHMLQNELRLNQKQLELLKQYVMEFVNESNGAYTLVQLMDVDVIREAKRILGLAKDVGNCDLDVQSSMIVSLYDALFDDLECFSLAKSQYAILERLRNGERDFVDKSVLKELAKCMKEKADESMKVKLATTLFAIYRGNPRLLVKIMSSDMEYTPMLFVQYLLNEVFMAKKTNNKKKTKAKVGERIDTSWKKDKDYLSVSKRISRLLKGLRNVDPGTYVWDKVSDEWKERLGKLLFDYIESAFPEVDHELIAIALIPSRAMEVTNEYRRRKSYKLCEECFNSIKEKKKTDCIKTSGIVKWLSDATEADLLTYLFWDQRISKSHALIKEFILTLFGVKCADVENAIEEYRKKNGELLGSLRKYQKDGKGDMRCYSYLYPGYVVMAKYMAKGNEYYAVAKESVEVLKALPGDLLKGAQEIYGINNVKESGFNKIIEQLNKVDLSYVFLSGGEPCVHNGRCVFAFEKKEILFKRK